METDAVYFRPNIQMEPLFNSWYALPAHIPPATAALYVINSHLKVMESFIASPESHASALNDPSIRSGPFISHPPERVAEIRALMEKTKRDHAEMIELGRCIKALDDMVMREGRGLSLEPLFRKIPKPLQGYVEIYYDFHNRPSFRFIESLLYKSRHYDRSSQSLMLSAVYGDGRAFVLNTPRLRDQGSVELNLPFEHKGLDTLFEMRNSPRPYGYIREVLNLREEDDPTFRTLFTPEPPALRRNYDGTDVRIRYFGHACVLIETRDVSIMIDPLISYQYDGGMYRYTYSDLPETIDYVLITHSHQDHMMFETLLQLRHKIGQLVVPKSVGDGWLDPSMKLLLNNIGFRNVVEIDEMQAIEVAGGNIVGLPFLGEHADLNIRAKMAHLVQLNGVSILMAADSNNIDPNLYEHIHALIGDVDVLFLGMECDGAPLSWMVGPLMTKAPSRQIDQARRFDGSNCEKGLALVDRLRPKQAYVYAMGAEPWLTYMTSLQYTEESRPIVESNKFIKACRERGIVSERLYGHKELSLNRGSFGIVNSVGGGAAA